MSARYFLDTNIFVYSFDHGAAAKARKATQLIRNALATQTGVISYQVVQEFFNVALRRFSQPMKASDAEQYLGTVFRPLLSVHSSPALYAEALHLHARSRLSWYDALIVSAALQAQCDVLLSEDLQHGRRFGNLQGREFFSLEQSQELVHFNTGAANQRPQRAYGKLFVLRNRKVCPLSGLCHDQVAADLTDNLPTGLSKSLCRFLAGYISKLPHQTATTTCVCLGDMARSAF